MHDIGLVLHTGLGCTFDKSDGTIEPDKPINTTIELSTKQILGIKYSKRHYYNRIVKFIRLAREIEQYFPLIQADIDVLNAKYNHLHFGQVNLVNPFSEALTYANDTYTLTSYHAMMYVDRPKLFNEFERACGILIANYEAELIYRKHPLFIYDFDKFGVDYRDDCSVFHRAVHHYKSFKQRYNVYQSKD